MEDIEESKIFMDNTAIKHMSEEQLKHYRHEAYLRWRERQKNGTPHNKPRKSNNKNEWNGRKLTGISLKANPELNANYACLCARVLETIDLDCIAHPEERDYLTNNDWYDTLSSFAKAYGEKLIRSDLNKVVI